MRIIFCILAISGVSGLSLLTGQTSSSGTEGSRVIPTTTPDHYIFSWPGESGKFYIIQHSLDLTSWGYIPVLEPGYDDEVQWGFGTNANAFFFRLKYTSDPLTGSFYGDDDVDGIVNGVEILLDFSATTANGNTDGDLLTDRQELALGLDPHDPLDAVDSDGDGVVDAIERLYGLSTSGLSDEDEDSMDDEWELLHYLNLSVDDSTLDPDGDGLNNLEEFQEGTNPWAFDSDEDTIPDGIEIDNGLNPLMADPVHVRNNYAWQFSSDLLDRFSEFSDRISQSANHTLALDQSGNVYGWGSNDYGQLGLGSGSAGTDVTSPTLTLFNISNSVAAGAYSSFAVNANGLAQAAGNNSFGQLGIGHENASSPYESPQSVVGLSNVKRIDSNFASSSNFRAAISGNDGNLYAWGALLGSNYPGTTPTGTPQGPLKGLSYLIALSSGSGSTIGLDVYGNSYTWGRNSQHILARPGDPLYTTPETGKHTVPLSVPLSSVSMKYHHGATITESGDLWTWASFNGLSQVAVNEQQSTPLKLSSTETFRQLAIVSRQSTLDPFTEMPGFVLDQRGNLWMFYWQRTEYLLHINNGTGQVTRYEMGDLILEKIAAPTRFVGLAESFEGLLLLSENGEVYKFSLDASDYSYPNIAQYTSYPDSESLETLSRPSSTGKFEKFDIPNFYNAIDTSNDGMSDLLKRYVGLNPNSTDTNGDGTSDEESFHAGIDGAAWDNDLDGIPNAVEIARGLNPNLQDSDGDGMLDNEEFYLQERRFNYILPSEPDGSGPIIQLFTPGSATAL